MKKNDPAEEIKTKDIKSETLKDPENIDNLKKSNEEKNERKVKIELDEG